MIVRVEQRRIAFIQRVIARINPRRQQRLAGLQERLNVHVTRLPVFEQRRDYAD